jgi:hypothetical protein
LTPDQIEALGKLPVEKLHAIFGTGAPAASAALPPTTRDLQIREVADRQGVAWRPRGKLSTYRRVESRADPNMVGYAVILADGPNEETRVVGLERWENSPAFEGFYRAAMQEIEGRSDMHDSEKAPHRQRAHRLAQHKLWFATVVSFVNLIMGRSVEDLDRICIVGPELTELPPLGEPAIGASASGASASGPPIAMPGEPRSGR